MAGNSGPNIVNDGLVLHLDAGNRKKSFLPFSTFLNMSTWSLGSGGTTGYGRNGGEAENERIIGTDPWGNSTIVWESRPSGNGNDDGGWNTSYYNIDKTKLYRFSVWVKRTSTTTGGTSYLGLYGSGGTFGVARLDNGATEGNPYWECSSTSVYTQNVWYLLVGHCYPAGTTGIPNNKHPDSGRYTINGRNGDLNYCNIGGDVRWLSDATQTLHRTYHYYCNDNTTRLQWFDPRIDLCDGTEPTIQDLLTAGTNSWRSLVNENRGILTNGVSYNSANGGSLVFDGTNDRVSTSFKPSGYRSYFIWVKYNIINSLSGGYSLTGTQEVSAYNYVGISNGGYFYYYFGTNGEQINSTILNPNVWYNQGLTLSNDGYARAYLNGNLVSTLLSNVGNTATNEFSIGCVNQQHFVNGNIAMVSQYNRALSAQEILQNYNSQKSRFGLP
jgi:hypothetical protein